MGFFLLSPIAQQYQFSSSGCFVKVISTRPRLTISELFDRRLDKQHLTGPHPAISLHIRASGTKK
jgi:hypothetical protein